MKKIYTFIHVYIMNLVFFLLSVFLIQNHFYFAISMPVDKVNTEIYMYTNTCILIYWCFVFQIDLEKCTRNGST